LSGLKSGYELAARWMGKIQIEREGEGRLNELELERIGLIYF